MDNILKYIDETDKSLGIAGMAIALVACDSAELLSAVSLEDGQDSLQFSEDFFFSGNPRFSAKIAWKEMLKQYYVSGAMLMSNVMCRRYAAGRDVDRALLDVVHAIIVDMGRTNCSLDDDEIETLYNKNFTYYHRLFTHSGVLRVAREFATNLRIRRTFTAGEVAEQLSRLYSVI